MKISRPGSIERIVGAALFCCLCLTQAWTQSATSRPAPAAIVSDTSAARRRQETFELVWQTVNKNFYDPKFNGVDWQAVHDRYAPRVSAATSDAELYSLLQLMVNELHRSHFWIVPPEAIPKLRPKPRIRRNQAAEETGEDADEEPEPETTLDLIKEDLADRLSTGIGIDVRVVDGLVLVTRVDAGSPAARAGLRPGFIIRSVDDQPLVEALLKLETNRVFRDIIRPAIPLVLVARYMNGSLNDIVQLSYTDGRNLPRRVRLVREKLKGEMSEPVGNLPSFYTDFEAKRIAGGMGYIRFNAFVPNLMKKVCMALREMHDAPGIILDLRGNEGGLLGMISGLGGLLQDYTSVFGAMRTRSGQSPVVVAPQRKPYTGGLAILIDGSTQSAAEIFAAGMQQTNRAVIVGDISAGNTLPSGFIKLPTGGLFQYALGTYETMDGILLEGRGVVPDWIVKISRRNLLRSGDPQLAAAITKLRARISPRFPAELIANVTVTAPKDVDSKPTKVTILEPPPPPKLPSANDDTKDREDNALVVKQVVDHYIEAVGGEAALLRIHTRVSTGTVELPLGLKGTIEVYEAAPNRSSVVMTLKGLGVLQRTFDGKVDWLQDPVRGYLKISEGATSNNAFHSELDFRSNLKFLRFERKEKIGAVDYFVLGRMAGGKVVEHLYFSVETGLLMRESDLYYEDYREVDGLKIPFVARQGDMQSGMGTTIKLKEVKLNTPIDESKFAERADCFTKPD